jgi:hypothetical protein
MALIELFQILLQVFTVQIMLTASFPILGFLIGLMGWPLRRLQAAPIGKLMSPFLKSVLISAS